MADHNNISDHAGLFERAIGAIMGFVWHVIIPFFNNKINDLIDFGWHLLGAGVTAVFATLCVHLFNKLLKKGDDKS